MPFDLEAAVRADAGPAAYAVVFPDDPRYAEWMADLGADSVAVESAWPHLAIGPDGAEAPYLNADVSRLDAGQRDRVARRAAAKFGLPVERVAAVIAGGLLPIRAEGLFVCPDPEACRETIEMVAAARQARDPERN